MRKIVLRRKFNFQPECFVLLIFTCYINPTIKRMIVHIVRALYHFCARNNLIKCGRIISRTASTFLFKSCWANYDELAKVGFLNGSNSRRISFNWKVSFYLSSLVVQRLSISDPPRQNDQYFQKTWKYSRRKRKQQPWGYMRSVKFPTLESVCSSVRHSGA